MSDDDEIKSNVTVICANRNCEHYDARAIKLHYPTSAYCTTQCKYDDPDYLEHNETYGD